MFPCQNSLGMKKQSHIIRLSQCSSIFDFEEILLKSQIGNTITTQDSLFPSQHFFTLYKHSFVSRKLWKVFKTFQLSKGFIPTGVFHLDFLEV